MAEFKQYSTGSCYRFVYGIELGRAYEWEMNVNYNPGHLVYFTAAFWCICMERHVSNQANKPSKDDLFLDLVFDVTSQINTSIKMYTKENTAQYLADIIVQYCYSINEHWWNGCLNSKKSYTTCGNLIGINDGLCNQCYLNQNNNEYRIPSIKFVKHNSMNPDTFGVHIKFCKGMELRRDKNSPVNVITRKLRNLLLLRTKEIENDVLKKEAVCDLIEKSINKDIKRLPRYLLKMTKNQNVFTKEDSIQFGKIDLSNVHIWGLFNNGDLLSTVIWRSIDAVVKTTERQNTNKTRKLKSQSNNSTKEVGVSLRMVEILFFSTSEKFGQELYRKIEVFGRSNHYNLISVAAEPKNVLFWNSNNFQLFVGLKKKNFSSHVSISNGIVCRHRYGRGMISDYLSNNMVVFKDTSLYAKIL